MTRGDKLSRTNARMSDKKGRQLVSPFRYYGMRLQRGSVHPRPTFFCRTSQNHPLFRDGLAARGPLPCSLRGVETTGEPVENPARASPLAKRENVVDLSAWVSNLLRSVPERYVSNLLRSVPERYVSNLLRSVPERYVSNLLR